MAGASSPCPTAASTCRHVAKVLAVITSAPAARKGLVNLPHRVGMRPIRHPTPRHIIHLPTAPLDLRPNRAIEHNEIAIGKFLVENHGLPYFCATQLPSYSGGERIPLPTPATCLWSEGILLTRPKGAPLAVRRTCRPDAGQGNACVAPTERVLLMHRTVGATHASPRSGALLLPARPDGRVDSCFATAGLRVRCRSPLRLVASAVLRRSLLGSGCPSRRLGGGDCCYRGCWAGGNR